MFERECTHNEVDRARNLHNVLLGHRDAPEGCIRMKTFEEVLCSFEGKMDLEEAREMVAKIEVDKQGLINYVECECSVRSGEREAIGFSSIHSTGVHLI